MATTTPRLVRWTTCLDCLRRLARPSAVTSSPSLLPLTQTRFGTTRAELEDLQGIPVRLLYDIPSFGRKHAIIRVKPGRMRNVWFPKALAEYMTKQRFRDLGLSEAAIGVRDRTFMTQIAASEVGDDGRKTTAGELGNLFTDLEDPARTARKEVVAISPSEVQALLSETVPSVLAFRRRPISTPTPTPTPAVEAEKPLKRSPSLSVYAMASTSPPGPPQPSSEEPSPTSQTQTQTQTVPIFGSVSTSDIITEVKAHLLQTSGTKSRAVALDASDVTILGLDEGEDRIKRLGTFEILIAPGGRGEDKNLEPVRRLVEVVAEVEGE